MAQTSSRLIKIISNNKESDLKIPPHSISAEQSILGGLLLDNSAWEKIAGQINGKDFYRYEHRTLFDAIEKLENRRCPFDMVTVSEHLRSMKLLNEIGGESYLFELANNTPSAANIEAYAEIVRERSLLRQLIGSATDMINDAYKPNGRTSLAILDEAERKVFDIANQHDRGDGLQDVSTILTRTNAHIHELSINKRSLTGLSTGFKDLDRLTTGLQPADLIILAARPSMGKTTLAMNIAEHVVTKSDKLVLVFSMEMSSDTLLMRMMASLGDIPFQKLRTGQLSEADWKRSSVVNSLLAQKKLLIDDTPALTPIELRSRVRRAAREKGQPGLIVIDYLQLMRGGNNNENRTLEISEISRSLKALAKELNVPIIALSQLNRGLESRTDKRPMMSDLRDSGAIEQDADLIAFIYRDEVYHPNTPDKGLAELIIAKQRNGETGKVKLVFQGQYTRFKNYATTL